MPCVRGSAITSDWSTNASERVEQPVGSPPDALGRLEREPAREHGDPAKQPAARRPRAARGSTPPRRAASAGARSPCAVRRVSSAKRSESRSASCSTESIRSRAAASSIASGSPSRRTQIGRDERRVVIGHREVRPRAARARSTNSAAASEPRQRGLRQRQRRHAPVRLAGHPQRRPARRQHLEPASAVCSTVAATSAHAPSRCSQLSSTTSARRGARYAHAACRSLMPGSGRTPSASAIAAPTSASSATGASSTHQTPSGNQSSSLGRGLQREPRLAAPAGARHRQQPRRGQRTAQRRQLGPATDEARQRHRQVARVRRARQQRERRTRA